MSEKNDFSFSISKPSLLNLVSIVLIIVALLILLTTVSSNSWMTASDDGDDYLFGLSEIEESDKYTSYSRDYDSREWIMFDGEDADSAGTVALISLWIAILVVTSSLVLLCLNNLGLYKTIFEITKMDCPSEENLIKMKLDGISNIAHLAFDIPNRKLTVFHHGEIDQIEKSVVELNLEGKKILTEQTDQTEFSENSNQKKLLWTILLINFSFFLIEMTTGVISKSMGLVADSLDMLADSFVYGISLFAVGGTLIKKKQIAKLAGYFQITLAVIGFLEVLRRFFVDEKLPDFSTMIIVSIFALIANGICLYILQKSKSKEEAHMKASMIFTSNDVIINFGVIIAGLLVNWLNSSTPDLIIGTIVFVLVIQGAFRILKLGK